MEAKLRQLMKHEGINSTRLAEMLGIQASGISHIMSGRNKPSFDFIHKLLQRFPQINPDWLLLDKGPMYRNEIKNKVGQSTLSGPGSNLSPSPSPSMGDRTDSMIAPVDRQSATVGDLAMPSPSGPAQPQPAQAPSTHPLQSSQQAVQRDVQSSGYQQSSFTRSASIERIVVFYKDKTFSEYQPE